MNYYLGQNYPSQATHITWLQLLLEEKLMPLQPKSDPHNDDIVKLHSNMAHGNNCCNQLGSRSIRFNIAGNPLKRKKAAPHT